MWKTNKIPDKEFAPSMLGHHCSLEYLRVPCLRLPFAQVLSARASKWTWRASLPQMGIQPAIKVKRRGREREKRRERERHWGSQIPKKLGRETSSRNWSNPLLFRRPFVLWIKHGDQWVTQSYAALAVQTLIKTRLFSLHT